MGFSDRMRESLGAEGARVKVEPSRDAVTPGDTATATVTIEGGTRLAQVDNLIVRLIEAKRHWLDQDNKITEAEAQTRNRVGLMPAWSHRTVRETNMVVDIEVGPGGTHEVEVSVDVPRDCGLTDVACSITMNVQADIKGQIDPTGNATVVVTT